VSEQEVFIFEVTQGNFNTSVIFNSHKLPVFVEFMGMWSEPCIKTEYLLSEMAREFSGQFIFAKVDTDAQTDLVSEYEIKNIPTLKIFRDGEVVLTEEGELTEGELRALLKAQGIFRESDEMREQARQKHMSGETIEAIQLLTAAIQQDHGNTRIAMDMVQIFLDMGELEQAEGLFGRLPAKDRESDLGRSLQGQLSFKKLAANTEGKEVLLDRIVTNPGDHDAHFFLSVCLVAEHDYQRAMEHLFTIFEANPEYKEGAAKEMIISLTNMLAPNEPALAQEFRRRLGNIVAQ
jgi:putative thioredoxin